jgi:hypothetical protein
MFPRGERRGSAHWKPSGANEGRFGPAGGLQQAADNTFLDVSGHLFRAESGFNSAGTNDTNASNRTVRAVDAGALESEVRERREWPLRN